MLPLPSNRLSPKAPIVDLRGYHPSPFSSVTDCRTQMNRVGRTTPPFQPELSRFLSDERRPNWNAARGLGRPGEDVYRRRRWKFLLCPPPFRHQSSRWKSLPPECRPLQEFEYLLQRR